MAAGLVVRTSPGLFGAAEAAFGRPGLTLFIAQGALCDRRVAWGAQRFSEVLQGGTPFAEVEIDRGEVTQRRTGWRWSS